MDVRSFAPLDRLLAGLVLDPLALNSPQCRHISEQLEALQAASVVVEHDYVDGNYLAEYANYYVRCHEPLSRRTHRLHIFRTSESDTQALFRAAFNSADDCTAERTLRQAYLGFIILKPLPRTIFGKTCLTPPERGINPTGDNASDALQALQFPFLRDYPVLLWGVRLSVRSLAFQEQDSEVAACSTAAIWSALHALDRKIARDAIPSTFDITSAASLTYIKRSLGEVARRFPTSGLGLEQMEAYLRSMGLDCIVCGAVLSEGTVQLAEYLMAYASGGFPMLLVGNLYVATETGGQFQRLGLHAMTAVGYGTEPGFLKGHTARRMRHVFAHDDNLGPFSRYRVAACRPGQLSDRVEGLAIAESQRWNDMGRPSPPRPASVLDRVTGYLTVQHAAEKGRTTERLFTPEYFIVPVDPKVRLPYEGIALFAEQIGRYFETRAQQWYAPGARIPEVSWSIALRTVTDLKAELRTCRWVDRTSATEVLLKPFPKHVWTVSFRTVHSAALGCPVLDVYFDATALRQGGGLLCFLPFNAPDADTFFSVITACLLSLDDHDLGGIDRDLMTLLRAAARAVGEGDRGPWKNASPTHVTAASRVA